VELTLRGDLKRDNIDEVITATITKWLRDNANRGPVPYTLRVADEQAPWKLVSDGQGAAPGQTAAPSRAGQGVVPGRRGSADPRGRSIEEELRESERLERESGAIIIGGARGRQEDQGVAQQRAAGSASLEQLAPITRPEDAGAGSVFTVQFEAVLKKPKANDGGAA
jgi:hypothetical protein